MSEVHSSKYASLIFCMKKLTKWHILLKKIKNVRLLKNYLIATVFEGSFQIRRTPPPPCSPCTLRWLQMMKSVSPSLAGFSLRRSRLNGAWSPFPKNLILGTCVAGWICNLLNTTPKLVTSFRRIKIASYAARLNVAFSDHHHLAHAACMHIRVEKEYMYVFHISV